MNDQHTGSAPSSSWEAWRKLGAGPSHGCRPVAPRLPDRGSTQLVPTRSATTRRVFRKACLDEAGTPMGL